MPKVGGERGGAITEVREAERSSRVPSYATTPRGDTVYALDSFYSLPPSDNFLGVQRLLR